MKLLIFLGFALFPLAGTAAADHSSAPVPPKAQSLRGIPPGDAEAIKRRNEDLHYNWLEQLSDEQRAAWLASVGQTDPEKVRRFGEKKIPSAASGYKWQSAAQFFGFTDNEIARLGQEKLIIEDTALYQSFSPYTEPSGPVFITSDSVLNGFHILFEDSFRELEVRRAFALREHLETILVKARELLRSERNRYLFSDLAPGWLHAQLVVGPAIRLLGGSPELFDEEVRDEIERQVEMIRAAEVQKLPAWLGPPSSTLLTIDYRRFKPVGFYTQSESLQNYFRAVRWLQSIPFRTDLDDELTAIGLLGFALGNLREIDTRSFFKNYAVFLGRPDDPTLSDASRELQNFLSNRHDNTSWSEALTRRRQWLLRSHISDDEYRKLNDAVRFPPNARDKLAEIQFRVLSAYRLPDSLALADTAESGQLPSGLAVAALLGSEFARQHLPIANIEKFDEAIRSARNDWHPDEEGSRSSPSLYDDYLDVLSALFEPPQADAPAFTRRKSWAAKNCLTALGSWAQMRHTFSLQAKESIFYGGLIDIPPGFVEPNPEFFARFANLVERTSALLERANVFQRSLHAEEEELRNMKSSLEAFGFHLTTASDTDVDRLTGKDEATYERILLLLGAQRGDWGTQEEFNRFHQDLLVQIDHRMTQILSGTDTGKPNHSASRQRWDLLRSLSRRLEAMAHKQLRQQSWSREEADFIRGYGASLAFVMGYFGNSWLTPRDDSPRWAAVAADPNTNTLLAVAVGRARPLHVLYPWGEGEVLCTGSVMTYYEYVETDRLTDEEWRNKLDSSEAPRLPDWLMPVLAQ